MKNKPLLSVIIPSYGEQKTIQKDISRLVQELSEIRYPSEIIVVIDGKAFSGDKSFDLAQELESSSVRVFGYETNMGKGYAVRYGMARSKGDIIAFIDSGMEISANSLSLALEHLEWYKADIIVGSKRHPASRVYYPQSRRILSKGYQLLVWSLFGLKVRDTQVGMKLFRREVLEKVLPRLLVKRYAFDVEMLAVSYALGYKRIFEAPVEFSYNFDFDVNSASLKTIYNMLWDTFAVYYRLVIRRYYSIKNKRKWREDADVVFSDLKGRENIKRASKLVRDIY